MKVLFDTDELGENIEKLIGEAETAFHDGDYVCCMDRISLVYGFTFILDNFRLAQQAALEAAAAEKAAAEAEAEKAPKKKKTTKKKEAVEG